MTEYQVLFVFLTFTLCCTFIPTTFAINSYEQASLSLKAFVLNNNMQTPEITKQSIETAISALQSIGEKILSAQTICMNVSDVSDNARSIAREINHETREADIIPQVFQPISRRVEAIIASHRRINEKCNQLAPEYAKAQSQAWAALGGLDNINSDGPINTLEAKKYIQSANNAVAFANEVEKKANALLKEAQELVKTTNDFKDESKIMIANAPKVDRSVQTHQSTSHPPVIPQQEITTPVVINGNSFNKESERKDEQISGFGPQSESLTPASPDKLPEREVLRPFQSKRNLSPSISLKREGKNMIQGDQVTSNTITTTTKTNNNTNNTVILRNKSLNDSLSVNYYTHNKLPTMENTTKVLTAIKNEEITPVEKPKTEKMNENHLLTVQDTSTVISLGYITICFLLFLGGSEYYWY